MWADLWNALAAIGTATAGVAALLALRTSRRTARLEQTDSARQDQHDQRIALVDTLVAHHRWHHSGRMPVDHTHDQGAMV